MHFSPDGRYFVAARDQLLWSGDHVAHHVVSQALDMSTRAPISLPGTVRDRIGKSFSFMGNDRIVGIHIADAEQSAVVTFPQGQIRATLRLGRQTVTAATRGERYVMLRGIKGYDVTVFDIAQGKVTLGNTAPGFDVYDDVFVSERKSGELSLCGVRDNALLAFVTVPAGQLGRLRAADISPDFSTLAISQASRGGAWNVTDGQRRMLLRGFRGVHFDAKAQALADFPRQGTTPRAIARIDAATGRITPLVGIEPAARADAAPKGQQAVEKTIPGVQATILGTDLIHSGRVVVGWKETKKPADQPTLAVYDASTGRELWARTFPKGAPERRVAARHDTLLLYWPYGSDGARPILDAHPGLKTQFEAMKADKDQTGVIELLDLGTGKVLGRVLIDFVTAPFELRPLATIGDHFIFSDSRNRTLVYSLRTGRQMGRAFGTPLDVTEAGSVVAIQNIRGEVGLYSVPELEKLDELAFPSEVAFARFSGDGTRLFVLTVEQTAYILAVGRGASRPPAR